MTSDRRKPSLADTPLTRVSPQKPHAGKRSSTDPYGTDLAVRVKRKGRGLLAGSYWDLWMILLADREFDADLERLAAEMRAQRDRSSATDLGREDMERLAQPSAGSPTTPEGSRTGPGGSDGGGWTVGTTRGPAGPAQGSGEARSPGGMVRANAVDAPEEGLRLCIAWLLG